MNTDFILFMKLFKSMIFSSPIFKNKWSDLFAPNVKKKTIYENNEDQTPNIKIMLKRLFQLHIMLVFFLLSKHSHLVMSSKRFLNLLSNHQWSTVL